MVWKELFYKNGRIGNTFITKEKQKFTLLRSKHLPELRKVAVGDIKRKIKRRKQTNKFVLLFVLFIQQIGSIY